MKIGEKISYLMTEKHLTPQEIVRAMKGYLRRYSLKRLNGILRGDREPDDKEIEYLSSVLCVMEKFLTDETRECPPSTRDVITPVTISFRTESKEVARKRISDELKSLQQRINVVGHVAADGTTNIAYDDAGLPVGGSLEEPILRPEGVTDPQAYALIIKGDSMFPLIRDGKKVVVCPNDKPGDGDIAIVKVKSTGKVYVKRIVFTKEGVILQSFNPNYESMAVPLDDITYCYPVKVAFL